MLVDFSDHGEWSAHLGDEIVGAAFLGQAPEFIFAFVREQDDAGLAPYRLF